MKDIKSIVAEFIKSSDGILRLRPAWVAHDFLSAGKRLGLKEEEYDAGERGSIIERWFCSETHADNRIDVADEGFSYLEIPGEDITVIDALKVCREEILGEEYAKTHDCLGRLIKIYDYGTRLFMHIHPKAEDMKKIGKNSKDEAYHYLDAPLGNHPESFFGVHRYIVEQNLQKEIFLPLLKEWKAGEEEILKYSTAFFNVPGEGFFLDSGMLHAPGTALTMEIQESSDVCTVFQPTVEGYPISKSMLYKDVPAEDAEKYGEEAALDLIDWELSSDPDFYEKRHLYPHVVEETRQGDQYEEWIYYGSRKFSGKRLILPPGGSFVSRENGVHNIFVWKGSGKVNDYEVKAGEFDLHSCMDELLITCQKAKEGYIIKNTGTEDLVLFKYFGPDINVDNMPEMGHIRRKE